MKPTSRPRSLMLSDQKFIAMVENTERMAKALRRKALPEPFKAEVQLWLTITKHLKALVKLRTTAAYQAAMRTPETKAAFKEVEPLLAVLEILEERLSFTVYQPLTLDALMPLTGLTSLQIVHALNILVGEGYIEKKQSKHQPCSTRYRLCKSASSAE